MSTTLITGADGHLGRALAHWSLANGDDELLLWVRAANAAQFQLKRAALGDLASSPRCRVVYGDLRQPQPFAQLTPAGIRTIIHCAAVTDFGVAEDIAQAVNVDGTAKLIEFAQSCPNLSRFAYLGSLYAAGLREGAIDEAPLPRPQRFANHYEQSKWQAEALLQEYRDLPWQVFRIATLLCDDDIGTVRQQNVVHNTLRLLYYGLLPVVPGDAGTRVYLVTTDAAVAAIGTLLDAREHRFFNVSDDGEHAMTLGALLQTVYEAFMRDDAFARHGILPPRFCDQASFDLLAGGVGSFGGAMAQALGSVVPFAPQLYSDKDVTNNNARVAMPACDRPALLQTVCERLVASRWGIRDNEGSRQCA